VIEHAVYEGINVNVTLLFAVSAYESCAEAYMRGLERRHAQGLPLQDRCDSAARRLPGHDPDRGAGARPGVKVPGARPPRSA
jgi:hypothetical protein